MRWLLPMLLVACSNSDPAAAEATADAESTATADATADAVAIADAEATADAVAIADAEATADADAGAGADADAPSKSLDPDGVEMLEPTKPTGLAWRLGTKDPNTAKDFEIEQGDTATKKTSGGLTYWNLPSHSLSYASGGTGWTSRLHIYASGTTTQLYTWKTQKGWLATSKDIHDQEFTVYVRPHTILDPPRAQMTLKIRGGKHTDSNPSLASCTMTTIGAPTSGGIARFGKELDHPTYDYVKLTPLVPAQLTDDKWIGLKLVSYQRPGDTTKVQYRMYVDRTPFDASGKPNNTWEAFSTYEDVEGKDTGAWTKLVDWGGMVTTFRTDGLHDIDFTLLSVREIVAPPT